MELMSELLASCPREYIDCLLWSLFFGFLHISVPASFNAFQQQWWSGLKSKLAFKRSLYPLCCCHTVITP